MKERIGFWIESEVADEVRQKLLNHKRATGERKTITDICTEALQKFITPKEGNEMENKFRTYFKDTLNDRWLRMYEGQRSQGLETFSVKNVPADVADETVQEILNRGGFTLNLHRDPVTPSRAIETGWMEWEELNA